MTAPHLPPKSDDLKVHRPGQSLVWLAVLVFVAALTSVSLSLATLVWLAPSVFPDQVVTRISRRGQVQREQLDSTVITKVRERMWHVYDTRQKIDKQFYREDALKLSTMLFSSDGWAVTYAPDYQRGVERFWEGVDPLGVKHDIEQVFLDPVSDFLYIKFEGEGFPFVSFANWDTVGSDTPVWVFSRGEWEFDTLGEPESTVSSRSVDIWRPHIFHQVADGFSVGSVVVDESGDMIGMVSDEHRVLPSWILDSQYARILENGKTNYTGLPWRGYMVEGLLENDTSARLVGGFYVSTSPTRSTSSTIGVGDVILRVQNEPVDIATLSRQVLSSSAALPVTVLRDGAELEIEVEKVEVK